MRQQVILDTGPLVALLRKEDQFHHWSDAAISKLSGPLLTCEPVVVEACFLLRRTHAGQEVVMSLIRDRIIQIDFSLMAHADAISVLIAQYASVPMSLADACLVKMAELTQESAIMTLDSDFRIYRMNRNQVIPVIMPEGL
jgi:predicted nucleic acid-binding protein